PPLGPAGAAHPDGEALVLGGDEQFGLPGGDEIAGHQAGEHRRLLSSPSRLAAAATAAIRADHGFTTESAPTSARGRQDEAVSQVVARVSEREAEVLAALGEHLSNAQIAGRLHLSVRTVETHVSSLLRKLDVPDRRALAALAPTLVAAQSRGAAGVVRGLPATWTPFVGRTRERAELIAGWRRPGWSRCSAPAASVRPGWRRKWRANWRRRCRWARRSSSSSARVRASSSRRWRRCSA